MEAFGQFEVQVIFGQLCMKASISLKNPVVGSAAFSKYHYSVCANMVDQGALHHLE